MKILLRSRKQPAVSLHLGDCLDIMPTLAPGSVDMVLTDPPYGTIKGTRLKGWRQKETYWDTVIPTAPMFSGCNRVLRAGGALVLFGQEPYTSHLITNADGNVPFSYRYVWLKDRFANVLVCNKAPVSYTEDVNVFFKKYDTLAQHPLRDYARKVADYAGICSRKHINEELGHQGADHFFRLDSTQFRLCTEKTYKELVCKYTLEAMPGFMPYDQLIKIDRQFGRQFRLPEGKKYKSNVLQYRKNRDGLHPTKKPVALMEDLIRTYTKEGDTVLDFAMGSGTTGVACKRLGRKFIGIELDPGYFEIAKKRINDEPMPNADDQPRA